MNRIRLKLPKTMCDMYLKCCVINVTKVQCQKRDECHRLVSAARRTRSARSTNHSICFAANCVSNWVQLVHTHYDDSSGSRAAQQQIVFCGHNIMNLTSGQVYTMTWCNYAVFFCRTLSLSTTERLLVAEACNSYALRLCDEYLYQSM